MLILRCCMTEIQSHFDLICIQRGSGFSMSIKRHALINFLFFLVIVQYQYCFINQCPAAWVRVGGCCFYTIDLDRLALKNM